MPSREPHILLLSPSAKVGLTRAWAHAIEARKGKLTAWERDPYAPAVKHCQYVVEGGPLEDSPTAGRLYDWCLQEKPDLIVPTRHDDLETLATMTDQLRASNIAAAVSTPECIKLCADKVATHTWLSQAGHPVPQQTTVAAWNHAPQQDRFPVVAKDPRGSGSAGIRLCRTSNDLAGLPGDWLLQSVAPGIEYTVNVYVDRRGRCVCAIPHERMLVHDGEVVRARTTRNAVLMKLAQQIAESLPSAVGPLNIQMFWDGTAERATVIEINPRFGGGYPLAHRAGGKFVEWLLQEFLDDKTPARMDDWEENLLMVRYRDAEFFSDVTG